VFIGIYKERTMPNLPEKMMAVRLFEYGDPSVLQYVEVPLPEIAPDEVLVRVRAASVNNWDLNYRKLDAAGRLPFAVSTRNECR
jgi:NADPH:quinone reductase-like Zn-dependent oxidoreductase